MSSAIARIFKTASVLTVFAATLVFYAELPPLDDLVYDAMLPSASFLDELPPLEIR
jgi:hypothetical protein